MLKPLGEGKLVIQYSDDIFKYTESDPIKILEILKTGNGPRETYSVESSTRLRSLRGKRPPMWSCFSFQYSNLFYTKDSGEVANKPDIGKDWPDVPSLSDVNWKYWHAYVTSPEKMPPKYWDAISLWYSGLNYFESRSLGRWSKDLQSE